MKGRILTLVVEVDQAEPDLWHWIYDAMKIDEPVNGLKIFALANGNVLEERDALEARIPDEDSYD